MKKIISVNLKSLSFIMFATLSGCASRPACPSVAEEPVSMCRAEAACGGYGNTAGILLAGFNPTNNRSNAGVDRYNSCVEQNLSAQRAGAGY